MTGGSHRISLWKPFCWVVIFGLASSMVMTLVAIPAIYRLTSYRARWHGAARESAVSPA